MLKIPHHEYLKLDPLRLIRTGEKISKYMGFSREHWQTTIAPRMKRYGCLYLDNNCVGVKRNYAYVTSPLLINLFIVLESIYNNQNTIKGTRTE